MTRVLDMPHFLQRFCVQKSYFTNSRKVINLICEKIFQNPFYLHSTLSGIDLRYLKIQRQTSAVNIPLYISLLCKGLLCSVIYKLQERLLKKVVKNFRR